MQLLNNHIARQNFTMLTVLAATKSNLTTAVHSPRCSNSNSCCGEYLQPSQAKNSHSFTFNFRCSILSATAKHFLAAAVTTHCLNRPSHVPLNVIKISNTRASSLQRKLFSLQREPSATQVLTNRPYSLQRVETRCSET